MKKLGKWMIGAALLCSLGTNVVTNVEDKAASYAYEIACEEDACISVGAVAKDALHTRGKSAYMMDFSTKTPMYAYNEKERLPIASMCKIMTLLLSFDAIEEGNLDIHEEICVSERAASMGGSQVFLEANAKYSVYNLIKSIVVCSANDSCVAMAERIAGSEALFVDKMNDKAQEIGAEDTLFANCTGLPKEPQYSCAKDVAIMLRSLLEHEKYYEFGKVWMDKFEHPKGRYTEISNTNKLVRFYDGCDGGKTGFTNEAGFCLAATAKRNDLRIISVVIGEETSSNRFDDVRTMFDYAFANYTNALVAEENTAIEQLLPVSGGKEKTVNVCPSRSMYSLQKRGETSKYQVEAHFDRTAAPIEKGERVGEMILFREGVEVDRVDLLAMESVRKANIFDRLQEIARNWNG